MNINDSNTINNDKEVNNRKSDDIVSIASSSAPSCLLQHAKLPYYLANAFQELYQEDGLVVLGRGLGLLHLLASFCRFYVDVEEGHVALLLEEIENEIQTLNDVLQLNNKRTTIVPRKEIVLNQIETMNQIKTKVTSRRPLVFVIGLKDYERSCLISILEMWGTPTDLLPVEITNENGSENDRAELYSRGGIYLITSRIFIVDLLKRIASPKDIDGILVAHAENVSEQSTEAFILRIYRTQKRFGDFGTNSLSLIEDIESPIIQSYQNGFIKAFSDSPDTLMSGFAKCDKILKALFVKRLYIYPRFHELVAEELDKTPPIVEELHQTLTQRMMECQAAIAAAVKACIREIKKNVSFIDWSDTDLTLENCVTTNFDMNISHQLESDWHRLKPATKQLVQDLRQLRKLFHYLLHYDCITFWKLINNIKTIGASSRNPSMWLLSGSADVLFRVAKERIYSIVDGNKKTEKNKNPVKKLIPNLEENPKWRLLHQVLSEIENQYNKKRELNKSKSISDDYDYHFGGNTVLVMVRDHSTLKAVRSYLVDGKEKTMKQRWLRHLNQINNRTRSLAKSSGGNISQESRLLCEEESKIRHFLYGNDSNIDPLNKNGDSSAKRKGNASLNVIPEWKRKRQKIQEERSRGNKMMSSSEDRKQMAVIDEAVDETEHYNIEILSKSTNVYNDNNTGDPEDMNVCDKYEDLFEAKEVTSLRVSIQTYNNNEGEKSYLLLNDIKPDYIILYDAEPSFIRSIEIHSAQRHDDEKYGSLIDRIRVYFMLFEASSEEKNYIRSLEREQNAFEKLIQHKKTMAVPINMLGPWTTQEMQLVGGNGLGGSYHSGSLPLSIDTRTGRGKKVSTEKRDIAVDVREFRSALPSMLHQGGMRLAPVTLTVGDYVLSNVHCVERKSISDLFSSFAKGRLLNQAQTMSKYYQAPCLLIEFDPNKTFCLQNVNELGPDIRMDSTCMKMVDLMIDVPKLRILWSRSPHDTLKVFKALKTNHDEVDIEKAVAIGSNEALDAQIMGKDSDDEGNNRDYNEEGRKMLRQLPGITDHNMRKVMSTCDSIAELASLSREDMKKLLGPLPGQKLFTFFNQRAEFKNHQQRQKK